MHLHHEVTGQGPDLVLLHGWGLHGGIWSTVLARLADAYRVHVVDLPGHGRSPGGPWDLEVLAEELLDAMPAASTWLGWSLGGLVALAAASRSDRLAHLILVAATPRFVSAPDWPCGIAPEVLAEFATALERDYGSTITRFLSLQAGDGPEQRSILRRLRAEATRYGEPDRAALRSGLAALRHTDLRDALAHVGCPATVIQGGHDRLVPSDAATRLARMLPRASAHVLASAGHAPFLSAPETFVRLCREARRD